MKTLKQIGRTALAVVAIPAVTVAVVVAWCLVWMLADDDFDF